MGEIQPDDPTPESHGDIAGAATEIEDLPGMTGQLNQPVFPAPVQAEAHQVVEPVVAPGDGAKKGLDLIGPLVAGLVEPAFHRPRR